jgi:hypothetical protein
MSSASNGKTGLPESRRRRATTSGALAGQFTIGLVFIATCLALTLLLSNGTIRRVPEATFASAQDWPEIRNGVPELKPGPKSEPLMPSNSVAPVLSGDTAEQSGAPQLPSEAEASGTALRASVASGESFTTSPQSAATSSTEHGGELPLVRLEGSMRGEPPASTTNAAPSIAPSGHTQSMNPAPQPKDKSRAFAPTAGNDKAKQRKERLAETKRSRTAAVLPPARPPDTTIDVAQPAPQSERIRLLGIALPTGREIKECVLEFRC